ncbi:MAG: ABC transporter substrate-binding protein [Pseudonocardiaceae bacterium]
MAILWVMTAGCSGGPSAQEAPADTLVIALSDEPDNLNPIFGDLYGSIYGDHWPIFSSLLDHGQDVELEPDLAAELPEISTDGRTVTVPLRDDVTWHDGEPFTL